MKKIFLTTQFLALLILSFGQETMDYFLIAGTYTSGKSEGIYIFRFDSQTADFKQVSIAKNIKNPSFLCVDQSNSYVYAVSEMNSGGEVVAYQFINPSGIMIEKKRISSSGKDPCYISLHPTKPWLSVGNYSSGNFMTLPSLTSGKDFEPTKIVEHSGSGPNKGRQEAPHVHATFFSPDGKYLFTPDLGTDRLNVYQFDVDNGSVLYKKNKSAVSEPGSGPRHLDFHPNGKWVYLMEELSSTVVFYHYHNGKLSKKQRISALAEGFKGYGGSADIHVSPDGRFLYCSNRGDANDIAIFSIDSNGRLKLVGHQPALGITPRNFSIAPGGDYLLVANQDSDQIVIFRRDQATGLLQYTGKKIQVPSPVCIAWVKMAVPHNE